MCQNKCVVFPRPEDTIVVHNIKHQDGCGPSDLTLDSFRAMQRTRRDTLLSLSVLLLLLPVSHLLFLHISALRVEAGPSDPEGSL